MEDYTQQSQENRNRICFYEEHQGRPIEYVNLSEVSFLHSRFLCSECIKIKNCGIELNRIVKLEDLKNQDLIYLKNWPPVIKNIEMGSQYVDLIYQNSYQIQEKYSLLKEELKNYFQEVRAKICSEIDILEKNTIIKLDNWTAEQQNILPQLRQKLNDIYDLQSLRNIINLSQSDFSLSLYDLSKQIEEFLKESNKQFKSDIDLLIQCEKLKEKSYIGLESVQIPILQKQYNNDIQNEISKRFQQILPGIIQGAPGIKSILPFNRYNYRIYNQKQNVWYKTVEQDCRNKVFRSENFKFYDQVDLKILMKSWNSNFLENGCRIRFGVIPENKSIQKQKFKYLNNRTDLNSVKDPFCNQNQQQRQQQDDDDYEDIFFKKLNISDPNQQLQQQFQNQQGRCVNKNLFSFDSGKNIFGEREEIRQKEKEYDGIEIVLNGENDVDFFQSSLFSIKDLVDNCQDLYVSINLEEKQFSVYSGNRIVEIFYLKEFPKALNWNFYMVFENSNYTIQIQVEELLKNERKN